MIVHEQHHAMLIKRHHGRMSTILVSVSCFLRRLPLFFSTTPKTPLRVLCMIALDTLHVLRNSKPLPRHRLSALASLLDFGACANAALDHKVFCRKVYRATRQELKNAGLRQPVDEYLRQLRKLEKRRPAPGGDRRNFEEVRLYREAIARLSFGIVSATALGGEFSEKAIGAAHSDDDLETLFRIIMQCQIIDDVLDYAKDASSGLPGFLTATASLPLAVELTTQAARDYGTCRDLPHSGAIFPFRSALFIVSALTGLAIWKIKGVRNLLIDIDLF